MTQNEKSILLKDLCARLPYVTYYDLSYYGHKTRAILQEVIITKEPLNSLVKVNTIVEPISYENIMPYLRTMSSMTEEEYKEYSKLWDLQNEFPTDIDIRFKTDVFDWLNAHHFDYRGLIGKGLAIEAPNEIYNNQK